MFTMAPMVAPALGQLKMPRLGVWAAEGFEKWTENFGLSERLRLHYFDVAKGSGTPENVTF
jgi:hypothetical protein